MHDVDDADAFTPPAAEGDPLARGREDRAPDAAGQPDRAALERQESGRVEPREARAAVRSLGQREQGRGAAFRRRECAFRILRAAGAGQEKDNQHEHYDAPHYALITPAKTAWFRPC